MQVVRQVGSHTNNPCPISYNPVGFRTWQDKQELDSLKHIHATDQTHIQLTTPTSISQHTHRMYAQRLIREKEKEETEEGN